MAPIATNPNQMLSVDVEPSPALIIGGFALAARAIHDTRKELETAVRTIVIPAINVNFEGGGIPAWAPLSNATLARRQSRAGGVGQRQFGSLGGSGGSQILVETGTLKSIATSLKPWDFRGDEAYMLASQLGEADYGMYHETGTRFMPQRIWSNIQPYDEDKIQEVFEASLAAKFMAYSVIGILIGGGLIAGLYGAIGGIINRIIR